MPVSCIPWNNSSRKLHNYNFPHAHRTQPLDTEEGPLRCTPPARHGRSGHEEGALGTEHWNRNWGSGTGVGGCEMDTMPGYRSTRGRYIAVDCSPSAKSMSRSTSSKNPRVNWVRPGRPPSTTWRLGLRRGKARFWI